MTLHERFTRRHSRTKPQSHAKVSGQRRTALLMIGTGLFRVGVWTLLLIAYLLGMAFAHALFASVSFVAILSVLALMLTDWGQVAASLAQLTAGDAHGAAIAVHGQVTLDTEALEHDLAQLAELQPGPDAERLADEIRARLHA